MDLPLDQIICGDNCDEKIRKELMCRGCGAVWSHTTGKTRAACPFCGKTKDARKRKYPETNEQKNGFKRLIGDRSVKNAYQKRSRELLRKRVLFRIAGTNDFRCVRCGCNDMRFLEINHKFGGGKKDLRNNQSSKFYRDIADGSRCTDDLEILCKPCNAIHALELKFGSVAMEVKWNG